MSWMPDKDPVLGDKRSCAALELAIVPRVRDLGDGFAVRRALPHGRRHMVGPFIFFDQMGPVQFVAGHGLDVRPHPHIGLATVTYLFDGPVMHRDSEGNALEITPGAMNLMTAGRGIAHSERSPASAHRGHVRHPELDRAPAGIRGDLAVVPAFRRREPARRPGRRGTGAHHRGLGVRPYVAGGHAVGMALRGSAARRGRERAARSGPGGAIYVAEGEVEIAGDTFGAPQLLVFRPGDRISVRATLPARLMFLGGAALEGPRYIWWNFVSRKERIEQTKEDWKDGRFAPVPGETEFIPLPES